MNRGPAPVPVRLTKTLRAKLKAVAQSHSATHRAYMLAPAPGLVGLNRFKGSPTQEVVMKAESLFELLRVHRPESPHMGFPVEVRAAVADYARQGRAQGRTWSAIAKDVGVARGTVRDWTKQYGGFLPVVVTPEPSPIRASLLLSSPNGFLLDGLDLEQAIRVLQAVG